jgi:hypothetical protein
VKVISDEAVDDLISDGNVLIPFPVKLNDLYQLGFILWSEGLFGTVMVSEPTWAFPE